MLKTIFDILCFMYCIQNFNYLTSNKYAYSYKTEDDYHFKYNKRGYNLPLKIYLNWFLGSTYCIRMS